MCHGYGCAPGTTKMEPVEEAAKHHRTGCSGSQIQKGKMCSMVAWHLLRPRKCVVADDGRYQETVAVSVRDDDGGSAEVADHPINGPVGRCSLHGTYRKTLPDTHRCRLHRPPGYGAMALFP